MLDQLARAEESLLAHVEQVTGLMDAKTAQLRERGVFASYAAIHAQYAALATTTDVADPIRDEALKRAVFLQWYTCTEPPCFSGIETTNDADAAAVISRLDEFAVSDAFDDELRSMLCMYFRIAGYYFEAFLSARSLLSWFARQPVRDDVPVLPVETMSGRGQLGLYWTSMLT